MASYNRIIMMGNLTRDPELKELASGQQVTRLGLASNRQFKNRQTDTMVQEVCFVDIDVWGPQAAVCAKYLEKGRNVLVEGRLKLDTWEDSNGQRRSKHFIVADRVTFLNSQQSSEDGYSNSRAKKTDEFVASSQGPAKAKPVSAVASTPSTGEISFKDEKPFEDDLPF